MHNGNAMNILKRFLGILLCFAMLICLTGCESQDVKDAKKCIDQIIKATNEIAESEYIVSAYSGSSSQEDKIKVAQARQILALNERSVEMATEQFGYLYQKMSEKERQIIRDYLDETYLSNLIDIWD